AGQIAKAAGVTSLVLTHTPPVPPQGIDAENHLQMLKEEAENYADVVSVDLAEPHKSWQLGELEWLNLHKKKRNISCEKRSRKRKNR
ncbi:hypothetical protein ACISOL_08635, partial [Campylobacter jejuni]